MVSIIVAIRQQGVSHEGYEMNEFKKQFSDFSSEYLLELRARGDDLSDEAHRAIEALFAERGERLPAKPTKPIFIAKDATPTGSTERFFKFGGFILLALVVNAIAKQLAHTWVGVLITLFMVIYFVVNWLRRQTLTPNEKEREDIERKAQDEGLTELMVCAANGNLARIRELVEFGGNVNSKSIAGTTALMYAARNNHLAIVEFLLEAGADPTLKSEKQSTAIDIARKFGHSEIAACLEQHAA